MKFLFVFFLATVVTAFSGCSKVEGEGGAATITGKIYIQDYTVAHTKNGAPYEGYDVDVYIVYGTGATYDDDFKTSYDGSYEFKNLRKGTYTIFVYSDIVPEPADPPKQEVKMQQVTISDKKGTVEVPDITINLY